MKIKSIISKAVAVALVSVASVNAFAQYNDIMLYSTDFSVSDGWTDMSSTGSSDALSQKGFSIVAKPVFNASGTTNNGNFTGYIASLNSTSTITTPTFTFISGGMIEMDLDVAKNNKGFTLSAASGSISNIQGTIVSQAEPIPTKASDQASFSGATFKTGKNYGAYKIRYTFDGSGDISFKLASTSKEAEVNIASMTVYTGVGSVPYVASPSYPNAGDDGSKSTVGLTLSGAVGGNVVTGPIDIKGYNLSGPVSISFVGKDAAKFSVDQTSLDAATAMAGTNVTVSFKTSVKSGVASALMKLSGGSADYYVNVFGSSGSGNPEIVASASPLNFWTSLIATTTQSLDVSGLNLTGPITASITGAGADRFSLSTTSIPAVGTTLDITFTGDIKAGELPASLVLSSPGAQTVTVPLTGVTSLLRPVMYPLTFDVSPSGTAYVETNPGGTVFLEGTQVTVTVTLESGYKVARWQDASGNTRSTRVFVVSESKNTMSGDPITVFTEKGQQQEGGGDPVEVKGLVALEATNITANSITANWTAQDGNANGYIVTVTDASGNVVATQQAASTATSVEISGLEENTLYYYTVEGTGTEGTVTTEKVGGFKTPSTTVKVCGSDDYND
ncbi:MAG: fibronectin type III domain-containing protein [Paludibacteraceae bacterium]|nr:fibronectin type III domain-containing protein [Paludibacteraceae bacterium]